MMANPLIQRYRYSILRPKQLWIYISIYVAIVLLIVTLNYSAVKVQAYGQVSIRDLTGFYVNLFYQFLGFQVIILLVWSVYNSGSAIKEEVLNKSYDFFRMLPLSAHKKACGILIGKNLVVIMFAAINLLFLICFGLAGKISVTMLWQTIMALISITIMANCTALLASINTKQKKSTLNAVKVVCIIFFVIPMALSSVGFLMDTDNVEDVTVKFFQLKIPILVLVSCIALYFGTWAFKGALRKFTHEQEPLFTRFGAIMFLIGYIFIIAGLCYSHIPKEGLELVYGYWVMTLAPLLFILWGSLKQYDNYVEYSRDILLGKESSNITTFPLLRYSNLSTAVILFVIWAASAMGSTYLFDDVGRRFMPELYNVLILSTCYLLLVFLIELSVIYKPTFDKIGLFLGFLAALYLILPLILSAIFEQEVISIYSPIGFIINLFEGPYVNGIFRATSLAVNVTCFILPAYFIWDRYTFILEQRQRM